jgi:LysM repeat protein
MHDNPDRERRGFLGDIADALRHTGNTKAIGSRRTSSAVRLKKGTLIIGVLGVVLLIIFLPLFLGGNDELSREDYPSIWIRLSQLEKRLTYLEVMEERVAFLEQQEKALAQHIADSDRSEGSLAERLDSLSERVARLEKAAALKTGTTTTGQRKLLSPRKERYHEVRSGDTLFQIAQQYGIRVKELCRLNRITPEQVIYPGQKLLVTKKETE